MAGPYVLIVSLLKHDPMCTLFFAHLALRSPIRIAQYPKEEVAGLLSGASALVVVRGLFEFGNLLACAKHLGVPLYYFLDDNFMLIREEPDTYGTLYENYTNERVREALADFSGVLLPTQSLIDYFAQQRLHPRLMFYPPVAGPPLAGPDRSPARPLTVAFFGGHHRREPFQRHVFPAICELARHRPVKLIAAGIARGTLQQGPGLAVVYPEYDSSYTNALLAVAAHGVDILVHPSNRTANNIYKNPHVLINARALGAAPVFSNTAPYDAIAGEQVALLCGDSEAEWYAALERLADDAELRATIQRGLHVCCEAHFGGDANHAILSAMVSDHAAPGAIVRGWRWPVAAAYALAARVGRRLSLMTRPAVV